MLTAPHPVDDRVPSTRQQHGAGIGVVFGVGLAATGATLAGFGSDFVTIAGFGAGGGLTVGGFTGAFADAASDRTDWRTRVIAFAVGVSIVAGAALGGVTAWAYNRTITTMIIGGAGTGVVFGVMLGLSLVSTTAE